MQPPLWPQLLLQVILIAINAYFAATEIAVISLNEAVIRHQAEEGDKKAARLLHIVEQPTGFLSTIQIGITLAGFLGSAFAADNLAGRLSQWFAAQYALTAAAEAAVHTLSVILITIILSFFTLVFGELVPKRVAMKKSEQVARFTCGVVAFLAAVMRPLIWLLTVSTNAVLRLVHIDPNEEDDEVSEEGIRMMVDIGEEKGAIQAGEKEMIENIFEFDNMTAGDVMIHRTDMVMLWVDDTAEEIAQTIESSGLSRFPVYEEDADDIIGILNTRDWLLNARKASPRPVRELLRPAYFVPESVRTDKLFRDMQSRKIHLSIVVDEYGGTAGLVTMEDLLEEIVGNIYDEFDPQEDQEIIALGDNRWRIAGSAELDDVAEALDMEFPEDEESETLGGLVFAQLNVIPEDGSHPEVELYGLHIRVEELPEGFQTAEFALDHGLIDAIVERGELRSVLAHLLALHLATASAVRGEQEHEPGDRDILVSYEAVRENLASGTDTYNTVTYGDLTVGGGLPFAGGVDSARAKLRGRMAAVTERFDRRGSSMRKRLEKALSTGGFDAEAGVSLEDASAAAREATAPTSNRAWESVQLARNVHRPTALAYIDSFVDGFIELHGDRMFGDDGAVVCGLGWIEGRAVTVIAQEKGRDLKERIARNFGCPQPEGYRKSLRLMRQAEKFGRPVVCLVDTQGAFCGMEAEERGQGEAIAENILEMMGLRTPVISVVIGEGGSGGALALAAADRVYMLENAVFSVISPEGCASILWKDSGRVADAAQCLHITAADMVDLHVAEGIIPENFADFQQMCAAMTVQLTMDLDELCALTPEELLEQRYRRYRRIGVYEENGSIVRFTEH